MKLNVGTRHTVTDMRKTYIDRNRSEYIRGTEYNDYTDQDSRHLLSQQKHIIKVTKLIDFFIKKLS